MDCINTRCYPKERHRTHSKNKPIKFKHESNYTLNQLLSHKPLSRDEISGPEQEKPLISGLTHYLSSPEAINNGYLSVNNLVITDRITYQEVDLVQDALLINKGRLVTFHYEAKTKPVGSKRLIKKQLMSIEGVHPVWVEPVSHDLESRINWLREVTGEINAGLIIEDNGSFYANLRLDVIKPLGEVVKIHNHDFSQEELRLMLNAYALLRNIRFNQPVFNLEFEDGLLFVNDEFSLSTKPVGNPQNIMLTTEDLRVNDSLMIMDLRNHYLIKGLVIKDYSLTKFFS